MTSLFKSDNYVSSLDIAPGEHLKRYYDYKVKTILSH